MYVGFMWSFFLESHVYLSVVWHGLYLWTNKCASLRFVRPMKDLLQFKRGRGVFKVGFTPKLKSLDPS